MCTNCRLVWVQVTSTLRKHFVRQVVERLEPANFIRSLYDCLIAAMAAARPQAGIYAELSKYSLSAGPSVPSPLTQVANSLSKGRAIKRPTKRPTEARTPLPQLNQLMETYVTNCLTRADDLREARRAWVFRYLSPEDAPSASSACPPDSNIAPVTHDVFERTLVALSLQEDYRVDREDRTLFPWLTADPVLAMPVQSRGIDPAAIARSREKTHDSFQRAVFEVTQSILSALPTREQDPVSNYAVCKRLSVFQGALPKLDGFLSPLNALVQHVSSSRLALSSVMAKARSGLAPTDKEREALLLDIRADRGVARSMLRLSANIEKSLLQTSLQAAEKAMNAAVAAAASSARSSDEAAASSQHSDDRRRQQRHAPQNSLIPPLSDALIANNLANAFEPNVIAADASSGMLPTTAMFAASKQQAQHSKRILPPPPRGQILTGGHDAPGRQGPQTLVNSGLDAPVSMISAANPSYFTASAIDEVGRKQAQPARGRQQVRDRAGATAVASVEMPGGRGQFAASGSIYNDANLRAGAGHHHNSDQHGDVEFYLKKSPETKDAKLVAAYGANQQQFSVPLSHQLSQSPPTNLRTKQKAQTARDAEIARGGNNNKHMGRNGAGARLRSIRNPKDGQGPNIIMTDKHGAKMQDSNVMSDMSSQYALSPSSQIPQQYLQHQPSGAPRAAVALTQQQQHQLLQLQYDRNISTAATSGGSYPVTDGFGQLLPGTKPPPTAQQMLTSSMFGNLLNRATSASSGYGYGGSGTPMFQPLGGAASLFPGPGSAGKQSGTATSMSASNSNALRQPSAGATGYLSSLSRGDAGLVSAGGFGLGSDAQLHQQPNVGLPASSYAYASASSPFGGASSGMPMTNESFISGTIAKAIADARARIGQPLYTPLVSPGGISFPTSASSSRPDVEIGPSGTISLAARTPSGNALGPASLSPQSVASLDPLVRQPSATRPRSHAAGYLSSLAAVPEGAVEQGNPSAVRSAQLSAGSGDRAAVVSGGNVLGGGGISFEPRQLFATATHAATNKNSPAGTSPGAPAATSTAHAVYSANQNALAQRHRDGRLTAASVDSPGGSIHSHHTTPTREVTNVFGSVHATPTRPFSGLFSAVSQGSTSSNIAELTSPHGRVSAASTATPPAIASIPSSPAIGPEQSLLRHIPSMGSIDSASSASSVSSPSTLRPVSVQSRSRSPHMQAGPAAARGAILSIIAGAARNSDANAEHRDSDSYVTEGKHDVIQVHASTTSFAPGGGGSSAGSQRASGSALDPQQEVAAIRIQSLYRGHRGRAHVKSQEQHLREERVRRKAAARTLQKNLKRNARRKAKRRIAAHHPRHRDATNSMDLADPQQADAARKIAAAVVRKRAVSQRQAAHSHAELKLRKAQKNKYKEICDSDVALSTAYHGELDEALRYGCNGASYVCSSKALALSGPPHVVVNLEFTHFAYAIHRFCSAVIANEGSQLTQASESLDDTQRSLERAARLKADKARQSVMDIAVHSKKSLPIGWVPILDDAGDYVIEYLNLNGGQRSTEHPGIKHARREGDKRAAHILAVEHDKIRFWRESQEIHIASLQGAVAAAVDEVFVARSRDVYDTAAASTASNSTQLHDGDRELEYKDDDDHAELPEQVMSPPIAAVVSLADDILELLGVDVALEM